MIHINSITLSACALFLLASGATLQAQVATSQIITNSPLVVVKKASLAENELKRWSHLDLVKDTIPGMSVDKAYAELLQGKTGVKVIVDSGVGIEHEDLILKTSKTIIVVILHKFETII